MAKLTKILLLFWGIVLGSVILKLVISCMPLSDKFDFCISDYISKDKISNMLHTDNNETTEESW